MAYVPRQESRPLPLNKDTKSEDEMNSSTALNSIVANCSICQRPTSLRTSDRPRERLWILANTVRLYPNNANDYRSKNRFLPELIDKRHPYCGCYWPTR
jgi:hypothetical protein